MILKRTTVALAVWAGARHHEAHGGCIHPPYDETLCEPRPYADEEAALGKYQEPTIEAVDLDVLSEIETVERALKKYGAPEWFVRYLLFRHPEFGRFSPRRKKAPWADPEDPPRAFVQSGHMPPQERKRLQRSQVAEVRRTEREFLAVLWQEIENRPSGPCEARAPDARSGSRARRGTA